MTHSRELCLIILATFALITSGFSLAETVVTQGVGTTCDDALSQAKSIATERVAGSYLNNERSLHNDAILEEKLNEYTSGVITSFKVLESDGGKPCRVTIQANVDIERSKVLAPPIAKKSIDLGHIGALVDKRKDGISMISKLINRPDQFYVDISELSYTPGTGSTQIDFEIKKITYSAQWKSDLEALLSVQSKPRTYERPGAGTLAKGLLALVALPVLIPAAIIAAPFMDPQPKIVAQDTNSSICFEVDKNIEKMNCYDGPLAQELMNQLAMMTYSVALRDSSGNLFRLDSEKRFSMIRYFSSPVPYQSDGTVEKRQNFILVGSSEFPRREILNVKDIYLKQGMGLAFVVGKPNNQ